LTPVTPIPTSERAGPSASAAPATRTFRSTLAAAVLFLLVLLVVMGLKSYRDLSLAHGRVHAMEAEKEATEERIEELHRYIDRLKTDPLTLEQRAREDLGLVRPDDVVILLGAPAQEASPQL
jgi:cell division protein FtsB